MSVKVVVVGAGGLVGTRMCEQLVSYTTFAVGDDKEQLPLKVITLFDMRDVKADLPASVAADPRVQTVAGDLTDRATLDALFDPEGCSRVTVIQLAALLSGYAESDFDLGMKVNLQGAIGVMEAYAAAFRTLASLSHAAHRG